MNIERRAIGESTVALAGGQRIGQRYSSRGLTIQQNGRCGIDSRMSPIFEAWCCASGVSGLTSQIPYQVVGRVNRCALHLPLVTPLSLPLISARSDFTLFAEHAGGFNGRMVVPRPSEAASAIGEPRCRPARVRDVGAKSRSKERKNGSSGEANTHPSQMPKKPGASLSCAWQRVVGPPTVRPGDRQ